MDPLFALAAIGVVVAAAVVAGISRLRGWPAPLVLVGVGLVASLLLAGSGRVSTVSIDPELVLLFVLPPLLYSAALESSYLGFRANLRAIGLLSVGLVLFTTLVVGYVAHLVVPGLPLPAAFVLGAIVAPPDAVAATAVGRTLGLPRRLLTILGGESLVNDATALTAYRVAVAAVVGTGVSVLQGLGVFVLAAAGGVALGLAAGLLCQWLLRQLQDSLLENSVSLLAPFVVYATGEQVHASGVLAVVVTGLLIGHHAPRTMTAAARLQAESLWRMVDFLLESLVFLLIGLQLPTVLDGISGVPPRDLLWWSAVVLGTVVTARFVWVYPATYLPRLLPGVVRREPKPPPWTYPTVVGWAGMRGVVSLAAAFALPLTTDSGEPFPERSLILFLTFVVVVGTLAVQGFTLPWLIRRLHVVASEGPADALAEAAAQHRAARAAVDRLDQLVVPETPEEVVVRLREQAERRALSAWERLGGGAGRGRADEVPTAVYRRLRREMLAAEREEFLWLRDAGRIDDEVLRAVQRELDLEDALLARE